MKRARIPENDLPPQIRIAGDHLQVLSGKSFAPPPAHAKRERITQFTPAARLRLTTQLAEIDYTKTKVSVCITLTYPDDNMFPDKDRRAVQIDMFQRHIEKYLGHEVYGVWRVEWAIRKSGINKGKVYPHIHLIVFGVVFIHFKKINTWWKSVIHYDKYLRTEIKRARSKQTTLKYLAKYIKKKGEASLVYAPYSDKIDGRHYGWIRKCLIPMKTPEWITSPSEETLNALLAKHRQQCPTSDAREGESFRIIGQAVPKIAKLLRKKDIDKLGEVD